MSTNNPVQKTSIWQNIRLFYRNANKPAFWFACIAMLPLLAFLPGLPQAVTYAVYALFGLYMLTHCRLTSIYTPLVLFLLYIPLQLMALDPPEFFRSWQRFALFTLLLICVSPLLNGTFATRCRKDIFQVVCAICAIIGVGSFISYFLGINYMVDVYKRGGNLINMAGMFGGLTTHSMMLGPISAIGAMYCCWIAYRFRRWFFWILAIACMFSTLFSASRAALIGSVAGIAILLYKMSGSSSTYIKILMGIIIAGSLSFPLWDKALDPITEKTEKNINKGSFSASRDALWDARIEEFEKSPVLGVGFDALDLDISRKSGGYDLRTGQIEAGSSWLIIFSMTGIIGAICLIPMFITLYIRAFRQKTAYAAIICAALTFLYLHMMAEGYIFFGGSTMAFILWLTLGVANDLSKSQKSA